MRTLLLICLFIGVAAAQAPHTPLQPGTPIERSIGPRQTHSYTVSVDENSLVQVTVEQKKVDVVVSVFSPPGKRLGEYDSPNGDDGPENVSFVTVEKGAYRIDVTPLNQEPEGPNGRYQIKIVELRQATDQEIKGSKNQEALKERGLALLNDLEPLIVELRVPQSRIKAQLQTAQLLWEADEKRALKFVTDAVTGFKEILTNVDASSKEYFRMYPSLMQLRYEIAHMLMTRQPEMALNFVRSTPPVMDPYGNKRDQAVRESALELEIVNQIARTDPKRTLELARETLKSRYSSNLIGTIATLREKNPEMAAELTNEIASKLMGEKLLNHPEAANLAMGLIRLAVPSRRNPVAETNGQTRRVGLLSDQQRRDLLQKAMNEILALKSPASNGYSPNRDYARNMMNALQTIGPELDTIVTGAHAALVKRLTELNGSNPQISALNQHMNTVVNLPVDEGLAAVARLPKEFHEQLYIQVANRAAMDGEAARARQILNDHVSNGYQRQQALANIAQQEMYRSVSNGKIEDALRNVASLSSAQERASMISHIASQLGPGQKRAAALSFLEQARSLLSPSLQAQDQTQMTALFEIAKAFSRYDSKQAFEIIEPLVDQFNDLCTAARTLEGFGGTFYEQEELSLQNGNSIGNVAVQMSTTLGTLALTNFDRAKLTSDRIRLPEVRLRAYLEIAQQTIQGAR